MRSSELRFANNSPFSMREKTDVYTHSYENVIVLRLEIILVLGPRAEWSKSSATPIIHPSVHNKGKKANRSTDLSITRLSAIEWWSRLFPNALVPRPGNPSDSAHMQ